MEPKQNPPYLFWMLRATVKCPLGLHLIFSDVYKVCVMTPPDASPETSLDVRSEEYESVPSKSGGRAANDSEMGAERPSNVEQPQGDQPDEQLDESGTL